MYQIYDGKNMNINQLSDRDDEEESKSFYEVENQVNSEEKMNDDTQELEFIPYNAEMKRQIYENPLIINSSEDSQSMNWSMFGDGKGKLQKKKIGKEQSRRKIIYFVHLWRLRKLQRGNKGKTQDF